MAPPVDTGTRAQAVVYEDVEVEDAAATGMLVRIGNTRTFVGRYVPAEGTTVRHAGDRGRLALPRWFVEQHGLPLARHEQSESSSPNHPAMPHERGDDLAAAVQLAVRVPERLLRRLEVHCGRHEKSIMRFVAEAVHERLIHDRDESGRAVKRISPARR